MIVVRPRRAPNTVAPVAVALTVATPGSAELTRTAFNGLESASAAPAALRTCQESVVAAPRWTRRRRLLARIE